MEEITEWICGRVHNRLSPEANMLRSTGLSRSRRTSCAPAALAKATQQRWADLMIEADLTGAFAHGIFRLPDYAKSLQSGLVNPKPDYGDRTSWSFGRPDRRR